jgi:hypothetical protein
MGARVLGARWTSAGTGGVARESGARTRLGLGSKIGERQEYREGRLDSGGLIGDNIVL